MKVRLLSLAIFVLCCFHKSSAQQELVENDFWSRHFISAGLGPSFATLKDRSYSVAMRPDGSATLESMKVGYGSGSSFALGYTFMISRQLGTEVNVTYMSGSPFQYTNVYYETQDNGNSYKIDQNNSFKAKLWKFNILFVARINGKKVSPYLKSGLLISTGNRLTREISSNVTPVGFPGKQKIEEVVQNTGGTSLGLTFVTGIDIAISKVDFLFLEMNYSGLSHDFKKGEVEKFSVDGIDRLSTLPLSNKEFNYTEVQSGDKSSFLTFRAPLSSITIMAGIKVSLQRK